MNIIVLGPQGSGKSTQARLLADYIGVPLFEVGSLLRSESQKATVRARKVGAALGDGRLVDDGLLVEILRQELADESYANGVVIDGAPRTLIQAEAMDSFLSVDNVFYLAVSDKVAQERLIGRGRFDDTPELIARRLELYHSLTEPVLALYREKGVLEEVDGERPVGSIFDDIKARIGRYD